MKIGFAGCSHSTSDYGMSWAEYMKKDLICQTVDVSVSGTSNEFLIEKIKKMLEIHKDINFFIVQLTDPMRLHFGLDGYDVKIENKMYQINLLDFEYINHHRTTNNIVSYNLLINGGQDINKILGSNYNEDFLNFIRERVMTSDFNLKIKIFHTLMTIQHLCNFYNKKVLFFSWYVDIKNLAKESGYSDIINNMNIVDGCVKDFSEKNDIDIYKVDITHFNSEGHKIIYENYIKPNLNEFIKNS